MSEKRISWIRRGLFIMATFFLCYGITRGEPLVVFVKAVNICLECIGIG